MNKIKETQFLVTIIVLDFIAMALLVILCGRLIIDQQPGWAISIFLIITGYVIALLFIALRELHSIQKNKLTIKMKEYNPKDLFLLTTEITSKYGARSVTEYYLATKKDEYFYELFTDVKIEKEEDTHDENFIWKKFNIPYIIKVEPLTDYVVYVEKKLTTDLLFGFITALNVDNRIKSEDTNEEDDDGESDVDYESNDD